MGVGLRLKSILRDKKMTIKQLSQESDIPLHTLYSITKRDSERVDIVILNRISETLGISVDELCGTTPPLRNKEIKKNDPCRDENDTNFQVGDTFWDGLVEITKVVHEDSGLVSVTLSVNDENLKIDELLKTLLALKKAAETAGIRAENMIELTTQIIRLSKEIAQPRDE